MFVKNETLWFLKWELSLVAIDRYSITKIIINKHITVTLTHSDQFAIFLEVIL